MGSRSKPAALLPLAIAAAYLGLAAADGGFSLELVAATTVALWWAVLVALLLRLRGGEAIPNPALAAGACLAALAGLTALSVAWGTDDGGAFAEAVRLAGYLGLFAFVVVASPRGSGRIWLAGLAIGLAALAALALGSRLVPSLPGDERALAAAIPSFGGRLSYPIGYWNALGLCMALGIVLLAWLGAQGRTRIARTASVAALPMLGLTLYLTSSRGSVAAAAVGLLILVVTGPARISLVGGVALGAAGAAPLAALASQEPAVLRGIDSAGDGGLVLVATVAVTAAVALARRLGDRRLLDWEGSPAMRRAAAGLVGAITLGALTVVAPLGKLDEVGQERAAAEPPVERAEPHLTSGDPSGRPELWEAALDAFASDPLTGIGASGYEYWWNQHGTLEQTVTHAHSIFLEALAELGLGGLALVVGLLAVGAVTGWRRRPGEGGEVAAALAVLAAATVSAAVDWTAEIPAAFGPAVVALALLTGRATLGKGRRRAAAERPSVARPRRRLAWGVATGAVAAAAIWAAGVAFLTEVRLESSRAAVQRGDLAQAELDADDAASIQPWASEPRLQLALVRAQAGERAAARRSLLAAAERAREDWRPWLIASRVALVLNADLDLALEDLSRARALNPRLPDSPAVAARMLRCVAETPSLRRLVERLQSRRERGAAIPPATISAGRKAGLRCSRSDSWGSRASSAQLSDTTLEGR